MKSFRVQAIDFAKMMVYAVERIRKIYPGVSSEDVNYYSFPEIFGSTAGPFGGIGGRQMTTFQIDVFEANGIAVFFCSGRYWKLRDKFKFGYSTGI